MDSFENQTHLSLAAGGRDPAEWVDHVGHLDGVVSQVWNEV